MRKVLLITSGISPFVTGITESEGIQVTGILDCCSSAGLQEYAGMKDIPYKPFEKQDTGLVSWICAKQPEVIAVFKMPCLLKKEVYTIPKYGTINMHPSLLPAYRGPNPWFWIYYNMEVQTGVTIHFVDEKEDTGNIISQKCFPVPLGASLDEMKDYSLKTGTRLMIHALKDIETIASVPQPLLSPTIRAKNVFDYKGMIDWQTWPVRRVWHLLNGFPEVISPDLQAVAFYEENRNVPIGQIITDEDIFWLGCKDGTIKLTKIKK
ncbi:MAG: hypothetical protein LUH10_08800 [Tannerellaceae bacterium]|nr:hypothetical protein [Tannerellaceae bacterium]